tara:strand:+ start:2558 stop:3010 length:453 start_codon:yes stop_codon:yes gene_type:complete
MLAFVEDGAITKYQVNATDVQNKYPNTSFPFPLEEQDLTSFGIVTVLQTDKPDYNVKTHSCSEGTPAFSDNAWRQTWVLTAHDQAKLDQLLNSDKTAARSMRDKLLSESDWTQLPDAAVNASDWTAYRQALRDVPSQSGFPNDITWPTKP